MTLQMIDIIVRRKERYYLDSEEYDRIKSGEHEISLQSFENYLNANFLVMRPVYKGMYVIKSKI